MPEPNFFGDFWWVRTPPENDCFGLFRDLPFFRIQQFGTHSIDLVEIYLMSVKLFNSELLISLYGRFYENSNCKKWRFFDFWSKNIFSENSFLVLFWGNFCSKTRFWHSKNQKMVLRCDFLKVDFDDFFDFTLIILGLLCSQ